MIAFLTFVAAVCLVLNLLAHGSTFVGMNLTRQFPDIWWLYIVTFGITLAALPALIQMTKKTSKPGSLEDVWLYSPTWLKAVAAILFVYAGFNFFNTNFTLLEGGQPHRIKGELVLASHGKVIRKLTPDEYERCEAYVLRGVTGHLMLFASGALMILLAYRGYRRAVRAEGLETKIGDPGDLAERASLHHQCSDKPSAVE